MNTRTMTNTELACWVAGLLFLVVVLILAFALAFHGSHQPCMTGPGGRCMQMSGSHWQAPTRPTLVSRG
jgi:hypothetical protein